MLHVPTPDASPRPTRLTPHVVNVIPLNYVVANPPFSDKRWSTGLDPLNDP